MRVRKNDDDELELEFLNQMGQRGVHISEQSVNINSYKIWLDEEIKEPQYYRRAFEILESASENDFVYLHMDSTGGQVGTAIKFINAIKLCNGTVMGVLENRAYSAGSMILLACPKIAVKPYASMMIHSVSAGVGGELQKMVDYSKFLQKESDRLIDELYTGFLTSEEIQDVKAGKREVWLTDEEVLARLNTLVEYKKSLKESSEIEAEIPVENTRKSRARKTKQ